MLKLIRLRRHASATPSLARIVVLLLSLSLFLGPAAAAIEKADGDRTHLEIQSYIQQTSLYGAFSDDGAFAYTVSSAGLNVWQAKGWRLVKTLTNVRGALSVFSLDGRRVVVTTADGKLSLVDILDETVRSVDAPGVPSSFDVSPSKSLFALCANFVCTVYDRQLNTKAKIASGFRALFRSDSSLILVKIANGQGAIVTRDLASNLERPFPAGGCGAALAISPDRRSLACLGPFASTFIRVLDTRTGAQKAIYSGITKKYTLLSVNNNMDAAAFQGINSTGQLFPFQDETERSLDMFSSRSPKGAPRSKSLGFKEQAAVLQYAKDGSLDLYTFKGSIYTVTKDEAVKADFDTRSISFENNFPAYIDKMTFRVRDGFLRWLRTMAQRFPDHDLAPPFFSPDGRIAFAKPKAQSARPGFNHVIAVDMAKGTVLDDLPEDAVDPRVSEDGRSVLYRRADDLMIRNMEGHTSTRVPLRLATDNRGPTFGFLRDGKRFWAIDADTSKLNIYRLGDREQQASIESDGALVLDVAGQREGSGFAVVSRANGEVAKDVASFHDERGNRTGTLQLEATGFRPFGMHFSADDKTLVTDIPRVQGWDVKTGKTTFQAVSFVGDKSIEWVVVTSEGFFDASPNGAKYLNLVRALKVYSLNQAFQSLYRPDLVQAALRGDPDGKLKAAAATLDLDRLVQSGAEPAVTFTTKAAVTPARTQDVAITLADAGGGIGKVEWRVNGVTQGLDQGGIARNTALDENGDPKPSGKTIDLHHSLPLEPGANKIEVVAYNAAGLIASNPVGITITRKADQVAAPEAAAAATPRLFVLAVGVNDYYDGRLRLAYAVPDAQALADGFQKAGAGLYSSVEVTTLLNQDVTKAKLDATFAGLGQKIKSTDVFVFFIAGHGKTVDGHYHFIPYDFQYRDVGSVVKNGIDQDHLQAWLSRIPARKSLLLTDTCESGSLTEDPMRVASRGLETVEAQTAAIELLTRAVGRTVLSASTDDAPALEGYNGHGVFSYAVLDALAHAQAGSDGFITVTSLAGFVDQRVQDVSYKAFHIRQIPQMKVVGSNFPVAHRLTAALVNEDASAEATAASTIPAKPTHVVIAAVTVRATADVAGAAVTDLAPGTQVTLVQTASEWTIIARDGKKLGYVKSETLVRLQ